MLVKNSKIFIAIFAIFFSVSVYASNPSQPFLPSDNVQDPNCTPMDSNCYVASTNFSENVTGLDYSTSTSVLSLTAGYVIPTVASTTAWNNSLASSSNYLLQNGNSFGNALVLGTNDNQALSFKTNNSVGMTILPNGNVGIGTTTPSAKLQVTGTAGAGNIFTVASSTNTNVLTVAANGFVGIGSSAPSYPLDVTSTASVGVNYTNTAGHALMRVNGGDAFQSGYYIYKNGVEKAQMAVLSNSNDLVFSMAGTERMRILAGGNVGIGSTTAGSKLSVAGDVDIAGALRFNGLLGNAGYILQSTGTSSVWVSTSTLAIGSQWNTNSSNIFFNTGNVGIGTSTPTGKLHIVGSSDVQQLIVKENATQNANSLELQDSTGGIVVRSNKNSMPFEVFSLQNFPAPNTVPTMTSSSTPSGQVTSSGDLDPTNYAAWYIFAYNYVNGNSQTWVSNTNSGWVRYQFPSPKTIVKYELTNRNEGAPRAPNAWTFEGSNNGSSWTVLDSQSGITSWNTIGNVTMTFNFSNTTAYTYYRVNIATKPSDSYVGIGRLRMYEAPTFSTSTLSAFAVTAAGNIGIGTSTPGQKLTVIGGAQFTSVETATYAYDLNLTANGTLTLSSSDIRLKQNIMLINSSSTLEKINRLKPSTFDWKSNNAHDVGLIAQEVQDIFPELVFTNPTDGYMGVNYSRFTAYLISAIQELSKKIAGFDARFKEQDDKVQTKELCLDDVCVTKDQLKTMLEKSNVAPVVNATPAPTDPVVEDNSSSTPDVVAPTPTDPVANESTTTGDEGGLE